MSASWDGSVRFWNIATGKDYNTLQVIALIEMELNKEVKVIKGTRPGHVMRLCGQDSIGMEYLPFEAGLKRTVEWYVKNRDYWTVKP